MQKNMRFCQLQLRKYVILIWIISFLNGVHSATVLDPCLIARRLPGTPYSRSSIPDPNPNQIYLCDVGIFTSDEWVRLDQNGSESFTFHIPEKCVTGPRCGTEAPLWMNGKHPTKDNPGPIFARSCMYITSEDCCDWNQTMQVKYCSPGYFVYKLQPPTGCSSSYCFDDVPIASLGFYPIMGTANLEWVNGGAAPQVRCYLSGSSSNSYAEYEARLVVNFDTTDFFRMNDESHDVLFNVTLTSDNKRVMCYTRSYWSFDSSRASGDLQSNTIYLTSTSNSPAAQTTSATAITTSTILPTIETTTTITTTTTPSTTTPTATKLTTVALSLTTTVTTIPLSTTTITSKSSKMTSTGASTSSPIIIENIAETSLATSLSSLLASSRSPATSVTTLLTTEETSISANPSHESLHTDQIDAFHNPMLKYIPAIILPILAVLAAVLYFVFCRPQYSAILKKIRKSLSKLHNNQIIVGLHAASVYKKLFLRHDEFLKEFMEYKYGLNDIIIQYQIFSFEERSRIEALGNDPFQINKEMLTCLSTKGDAAHEKFLDALERSQQSHLKRLIQQNNIFSDGELDRPLTQLQINNLLRNEMFFVENLCDQVDDLANELVQARCINRCHFQDISNNVTRTQSERTRILLDIMRKRSLGNFLVFLQILDRENNPVYRIMDIRQPHYIVSLNTQNTSGTIEERKSLERAVATNFTVGRAELVLDANTQNVIALQAQKSIRVYFVCFSIEEAESLRQSTESGLMKNSLEKLYNDLLHQSSSRKLEVKRLFMVDFEKPKYHLRNDKKCSSNSSNVSYPSNNNMTRVFGSEYKGCTKLQHIIILKAYFWKISTNKTPCRLSRLEAIQTLCGTSSDWRRVCSTENFLKAVHSSLTHYPVTRKPASVIIRSISEEPGAYWESRLRREEYIYSDLGAPKHLRDGRHSLGSYNRNMRGHLVTGSISSRQFSVLSDRYSEFCGSTTRLTPNFFTRQNSNHQIISGSIELNCML